MESLDKKSNRMSRANSGVSERSEFPDLQRILDFLLLRNLLSNELFFTFYEFATVPFIFYSYFMYFSDSANNLSTYLFNSFLGISFLV